MRGTSSGSIVVVLSLCAGFVPVEGAFAQVPTKCLEIESILVDACIDALACPNSQEGQNEMVRFRVGPDAIALNEISVQWPNNSWNGLVQNATTELLTTALNTTVQGCGWLVEPPGGIIPPGSGVLMVTSTDMCVAANSFANLNDTLFIVFQAPGNISGHFANHNNSTTEPLDAPTGLQALRTLIMYYLPTSCSDTATYDRPLLVNVLGNYGGPGSLNDGATVLFSWPGIPVPTYINNGCQAPFAPITTSIDNPVGSLCDGGSVDLTGSAQGNFTTVYWEGGTGTFSAPTSANTTYTAGVGEQGLVELFFCAVAACGEPVCSSILVPAGDGPVVTITPSGSTSICPGQSVTLLASGADSYLWSTTSGQQSITVSTPGTYTVTGFNACGQAEASIDIFLSPGPVVVINGGDELCPDATLELTASGADQYVWNTLEIGATIIVSTPGTYSVTGTNACGQGTAFVVVQDQVPPVADIFGGTELCQGGTLDLTATGNGDFLWSTGATTAILAVDEEGTYSVTVTNSCGSDMAEVEVSLIDIQAAFQPSTTAGTAPLLVVFTSTSTPGATHAWDYDDGGTSTAIDPSYTFMVPGVYFVTLTVTVQGCTATASTPIAVSGTDPASTVPTVPNVFSPNGDGVNDVLQVSADIELLDMDLSIYNRWGQLVSRLERPNQVWDARTFAGEPVTEGTYFYVLKARDIEGRTHELQGSITVMR